MATVAGMVEKPSIVLVPVGEVPDDLLYHLLAPLSVTFGRPCRVGAGCSVPPNAYDRRRRQYAGSQILGMLSRLHVPNAERVLGGMDADCYAPRLNFILGQARVHARDAFIALPRLRQSFYGLPEDQSLFHERALKEAVHELGHTYGLSHCPDVGCVMHFSNTLHDTDVKQAAFCSDCRSVLGELRR